MPRTDRVARVVVAAVAFCACEPIGEAYGCGYDAGYAAMDCVLDDAAAREASQSAWESSCTAHEPLSADQQSAGDEVCRRDGGSARVVACDDPGDNRATLPDGCTSFGDDGTFGCPADVSGECLCCDEVLVSCTVGGDFCNEDADCCGGVCADGSCA